MKSSAEWDAFRARANKESGAAIEAAKIYAEMGKAKALARRNRIAADKPNEFVEVLLDGPPSHEAGRFVELEDGSGKGYTGPAEWINRGDGYWALRISLNAPQPKQPLQALAERAHDNAVSHGFWDGVELDDVFARQVMLVVTELAEAVEAHRTQEHKAHYWVGGKTEGWAVELADAFIRLADIIGASEVDNIDEIVDEKMTYNESRPRKHGKRY